MSVSIVVYLVVGLFGLLFALISMTGLENREND